MGFFSFILSIFQPSVEPKLQKIADNMRDLRKKRQYNKQYEHAAPVIIPVVLDSLFLLLEGVLCWYVCPKCWYLLMTHVLFVPSRLYLIRALKKLLQMWLAKRAEVFSSELKELNKKKRDILQSVEDTMSYKDARELLVKYDLDGLLDEELDGNYTLEMKSNLHQMV